MPAAAHFSAEEVNALLPQLEAIFAQIEELEREIGARANELQRLGHGTPASESQSEPDEIRDRRRILATRREMLEAKVDEIAAIGGLVIDLELAIVDFPSSVNGEAVFLSWQRGDRTVRYFHRPEDHFMSGRRPL